MGIYKIKKIKKKKNGYINFKILVTPIQRKEKYSMFLSHKTNKNYLEYIIL